MRARTTVSARMLRLYEIADIATVLLVSDGFLYEIQRLIPCGVTLKHV